ncbi:MAG: UTP--glucose-1-phosphate uridylyltransferase [Candidatus Terrybacteria bacterium]|nr:UTP--glucose-1-phosphate uridylyltransferase [Candidatus Terrybacteria bacterium]
MTRVRKAIIPVAGYGTRFLPATKSMPKEMLPIVDKPTIQYVVEEAVASGITDIIFVTGRGKRAIEDHFDTSYELEQTLVEREKRELLALVTPISRLARFTYVRQPAPFGNGDAVLRARHLIAPGEPFAVLFGDDIVDGKNPALKQLIEIFTHYNDPVMALSKVPRAELMRYGAVAARLVKQATITGRSRGSKKPRVGGFPVRLRNATHPRVWEIDRVVEKPTAIDVQRVPLAIIGKYVMTPAIFSALSVVRRRMQERRKRRAKKNLVREELTLVDGLAEHLRNRPVYGVEVEGTWYDCGSKLGYLKANIAFARKRPDLRRPLDVFLRKL